MQYIKQASSLSLYIGEGFCDYDEFISPDNRGQYNWPEVEVSDIQQLPCEYGSQNLVLNNGMATRECTANLVWGNYNGSTCATRDTQMLRILGNVSELK